MAWRSCRMSFDVGLTIFELCLLFAGIAFVFLISRAIVIGRKLVSRVYRWRAFWFAGVVLAALITVLSALISALFGLYPSTSLSFIGIYSIITWILVMFVYADRTILVTMEMDFLHRNILRWRPVRTLAYVVMFASVFWLYAFIEVTEAPTCSSSVCPAVYAPGAPSWAPVIFPGILVPVAFLAFAVTLGYALSCVIIGARRTSDMTMRRHVRWVGFSFLIFFSLIVFFNLGIGLGTGLTALEGDLVVSSFVLALVYPFYRALMSLTSIGRVAKVEKEIKN
jgi:hypothetical protein